MAQIYLDANLAVVKRDGDHSVIENDPAVVQSWRLDEIITSELFGLESAWPPAIEELFAEQRALVAKRRRTPDEDARLRELEQKLNDLPIEDNRQDQHAMVARVVPAQDTGQRNAPLKRGKAIGECQNAVRLPAGVGPHQSGSRIT